MPYYYIFCVEKFFYDERIKYVKKIIDDKRILLKN